MSETPDNGGWAAPGGPPPQPERQAPPPYGQPYGQPPQPQGWQQPQPPYGPYPPQPYGPGGWPQPAPRGPWIAEAEPGRPFHQVARTAAHRWWRPLVGSAAVAAAMMLLVPLAVIIVAALAALVATGHLPGDPPDGHALFKNDDADLAVNLAAIALTLPVVLLVAWGVQRRRPGTLSSVAGRLRWRWLLGCCGVAILFIAVSYGVSIGVAALFGDGGGDTGDDGHWIGWPAFLVSAAIIVVGVPFQAAAEEYVFRGWTLQALGACTLEGGRSAWARRAGRLFRSPWPGIVVGSAIFASLHTYTGWGILDIFLFGAVAAWITVRSGGLEASIALHVFNNLVAFLVPAAVGDTEINEGAVPWQSALADILPMLLYAAAIVWLVRRFKIDRVVPGAAPAPGPEAAGPEAAAVTAGE
ncbi:CPBP family intramembrane glutamic endopeptidase [Actinomadura parmotrematis]|uniref:CPBP family intramembrane metalloprotease n=1 Tax=Actinomadura parmotrematis TaxID=2864039 RepID=A0ABS7FP40_9ACTN|nr:CPBP family intramembrane glutamic endopeptidase [Actinomadura parmotrematis]MBW8481343.1 CPBP family intramembrane metalloprotease [Actinomadura parmotrematis]